MYPDDPARARLNLDSDGHSGGKVDELVFHLHHGGGYLGAYSGRIDHAWGARPDCRAGLPHPPTHYLKKVFVDTVVFTPHQLAAIIEVFGADHVLLGTDLVRTCAPLRPS